ncbi:hypothetical protein GCM10023196_083190 [Actinoallomurus vinaceus]|uniref:KAP NTPase domain-containing protein n=1 Tax=Actinoallomurus vinaceus TaxID=1080074 RepID=A0ABP8UMP6_9ACTN
MPELAWYQPPIVDAARSVLRSEEMQTAVVNTQISEKELIEAVVSAAPKLICSEEVDLVGNIPLSEVLLSLAVAIVRTVRARPKGIVAFIAVAGLVDAAIAVTLGWFGLAISTSALVLGGLGLSAVSALQIGPSEWRLDDVSKQDFQQRVLAPFLREQISVFTDAPEYQRFFHVTSVPSLSDLGGREQIAATTARERLTKVTSAMLTGSIALSGPRGAGKTTLLRGFCDSRFAGPNAPELRLMVSAPVVYDVRDFVVHLYKQLCLAVAKNGVDQGRLLARRPRRSRLRAAFAAMFFTAGLAMLASLVVEHASRAQIAQGTYLLLGGLLTLLGGMSVVQPYLVQISGDGPLVSRPHRVLTTLLSSAAAVSGVALLVWTLTERPRRITLPSTQSLVAFVGSLLIVGGFFVLTLRARPKSQERAASFEDEARQNLQQLEFLQTFSTGYSGTLAVPGGAQLGRTVGKQLAQQRLSLPEIVDQYREFASKASGWWRELHRGEGKLVIGIDEIDKIRDASSAEQFINDVKAIFGTPNCLYLVSVSDEALIGFHQRSPALRAAVDTAFDEMVRVERLSLTDVRELLRRRVAGISDLFIALCHVLSGGLPRDVLRTARALVEVRSGERGEITDMSAALIAREVSLIKQTLLRDITGDDKVSNRQSLMKDLVDETWPTDLMKAAHEYARTDDDPTSRWLSITLYYLATVAEAFGPGLDKTIEGLDATELLARARAMLGIDADIAGELVSRFRSERGLSLLGRPRRRGIRLAAALPWPREAGRA